MAKRDLSRRWMMQSSAGPTTTTSDYIRWVCRPPGGGLHGKAGATGGI